MYYLGKDRNKKLTQVGFKYFAACGELNPFDGFFLYLAHSLAGKAQLLSYFLEGKGMFHSQSEIELAGITRRTIMQKVRGQAVITACAMNIALPLLCMFMILGSISLPSRGSFQLSLTVLVHYRFGCSL